MIIKELRTNTHFHDDCKFNRNFLYSRRILQIFCSVVEKTYHSGALVLPSAVPLTGKNDVAEELGAVEVGPLVGERHDALHLVGDANGTTAMKCCHGLSASSIELANALEGFLGALAGVEGGEAHVALAGGSEAYAWGADHVGAVEQLLEEAPGGGAAGRLHP